ncbi:FecR domain-containing protein [Mucilaginibacter sp. BJC16-A38]|uniref:FecR family protein n=1 Tax=Mucilaginibacter phenanthrenivorans TaxID=1234842 RepID=UPI00215857E7|nr:FecR family protein [Mucilaginibacter phenanthrenivorans]MCR8556934.1 FecR domain-containing protein [Mucilaginibacter phenanthrenivorans]
MLSDKNRIDHFYQLYLAKGLSPDELKEFRTLLADPDNTGYFTSLLDQSWEQVGDEGLLEVPAAIDERIMAQITGSRTRHLWPRIAAAASIIFILSFGGYLLVHRQQATQTLAKIDIKPGHQQATLMLANGQKIVLTQGLKGRLAVQNQTVINATQNTITYDAKSADQFSYNTLTTARGEQSPYPLVLADGTKVWLNAESSITFPTAFNGRERIVKLTGEAYFEVAHNAKQPFKVQTEKQTIEDIGTSFNVNAYADEASTRTTLVEGSVKVNGKVLIPGQQSDGITIKQVNPNNSIAWKNGEFRFDGNNIQTVMRQLARWYDIDVSYQGEITKEVFYAKLSRQRNISAALSVLERTKGIHFKIEGRRITVIE